MTLAKRKIKMTLSTDSIASAIEQIEQYKQSLTGKMETLVERLCQVGIQTARAVMMQVPDDDRGQFETETIPSKDGKEAVGATVRLWGDNVLFIEFSSGITYGTDSFPSLPNNPNYGADYGMGTYPSDKGLWANPKGWWYTDKETGESKHTKGVRAYAPMYNADMAMRSHIATIAKEVFGG